MKKLKMKIIPIIVCLVMTLLTTGCVGKTALSPEQFENKMKDIGFIVEDLTYKVEGDSNFKKIYVAAEPSHKYQIDFYELKDTEIASNFYWNNVEEIQKDRGSSYQEMNLPGFKYTLTDYKDYKLITRIENTVIFVNTTKENKTEINKILKSIGY